MLNSSHSGDLINQNLLDFGATEHANNCRDAFTNFQSIRETAHTATGEAIVSYGRGDVVKMMTHGEVTFQNVLYIPTLANNLYSTSRLCCRGWDILMEHTGRAVLSHNNEVVGFADEIRGEYIMQFIGETPHPQLNALAKPTKDLKLWHGRLAHLGYRNLIQMKNRVLGMDEVSGPAPEEVCGWCMMGRQQVEVSRKPITKSTRFLDLLHFDLEGPLPTTFRGYRYFLIVKDDYTGLMFIYALKRKAEAFGQVYVIAPPT